MTIEIKSDIDKNEFVEEFHSLLYLFRKSGQSQSVEEPSYLFDFSIRCNIKTLEKDSLNKKYNTEWVTNQLKKLENLSASILQVKTLGTTYKDHSGACKCTKHDFLMLFTHWLNDEGVLNCGTCFKTIPLYRIAKLDQGIRQSILVWEQNYICCDRLQMGSTVGEKWAIKQISDHNSQLSKEGIDICSEIKQLTGLQTYYYLFNYRRLKTEQDKQRLCPSYGGQWLLEKPLNRICDFKCDKCELISSITSNSY